MPTRAESTISRATEEGENGARIFSQRPLASGRRRPQFRITPTDGGYFMEEALGGGRFWQRRAWRITEGGPDISADDIPEYVWAQREKRAKQQAEASATLREAGFTDATPLADIELGEDVSDEAREAAMVLRGLRWLLVWPPEAIAEAIGAYEDQWTAQAAEA